MRHFCKAAICILFVLAFCACYWLEAGNMHQSEARRGLFVLSADEIYPALLPQSRDAAAMPVGITDAQTAVALSARLPYTVGGQDSCDETENHSLGQINPEPTGKYTDIYLAKFRGVKILSVQNAPLSVYIPRDMDEAKAHTTKALQKDLIIEIPIRVLLI